MNYSNRTQSYNTIRMTTRSTVGSHGLDLVPPCVHPRSLVWYGLFIIRWHWASNWTMLAVDATRRAGQPRVWRGPQMGLPRRHRFRLHTARSMVGWVYCQRQCTTIRRAAIKAEIWIHRLIDGHRPATVGPMLCQLTLYCKSSTMH